MQKKQMFSRIHLIPWKLSHQRPPHNSQVSPPQEESGFRPIIFQVQGMHCASCPIIIERALKRLTGVQMVRVNVRTGKTELHCTQIPSFQEIQQAVQGNGYTILPWQDRHEVKQ